MNPFASKSTGDGKAKHNFKRRLSNTTVEIKQEAIIKEEPRDTVETVNVPRPPRQPASEGNNMIKLECYTDSEMYSEYDANCMKIEVKNEGESSKKIYPAKNESSNGGNNDLGDIPVDKKVNNPGSTSTSKDKKKNKRKVDGKHLSDRKKETNAKASKKAAVKRQKKHHCHLCNYSASLRSDITKHVRVHTGEKPFECKVCAKSFTQKSHLNLHKKTHKGLKPFECSVCSKAFSLKRNLRRHSRTHKKKLPFACSTCGHRFVDESEKQSHEKRCNGRRFECYLCQYKSFVEINLKNHMRFKHTGEKPFECAVCDMKFCLKSHLKSHLATHAKPRPIRCSKCWKRFTEEGQKNAHEGQCNRRLHQCYLCKVNAIHAIHLKQHMRFHHTGERPFPCEFCQARFAQKTHADYHMKHLHASKN